MTDAPHAHAQVPAVTDGNVVVTPGAGWLILYGQGRGGERKARQCVQLEVVGSVGCWDPVHGGVEVERHRTGCEPRIQAPGACSIVLLDFTYKTQNQRYNY